MRTEAWHAGNYDFLCTAKTRCDLIGQDKKQDAGIGTVGIQWRKIIQASQVGVSYPYHWTMYDPVRPWT